MTDVYLGQIMMTGFIFAQKNFAQCNGQTLGIAQNQALFSLLGTTYGGDGIQTFKLPDLRGSVPSAGGYGSVDAGWQPTPYARGQVGGTEDVTLTASQLPMHTHPLEVTTAPGTDSFVSPNNSYFASTNPNTAFLYGPAAGLVPLTGGPLTPTGGNGPHANVQPSAVINFNIALSGIFPSRN